ncbi:MAG: response regulator transcription factor [Gammaproteobacteria bacterium]|nr:response regulator transcription factor [Gammaproteobacteria bacterium]NNJ72047.1 response regulator transcription factor [Enterobacterales bacterium]
MRLLLVEDDQQLGSEIHKALSAKGYVTVHVSAGKPALLVVKANDCDAVILDLGLPDIDGLQVLKQIRAISPAMPVLILTARNSTDDKISGLDLGADDYLTKPFEMSELFARLRVVERRLGTSSSALVEIGEVSLDTTNFSLKVNDQPLNLARKELMVLKALMENADRILSREQLESKLYEWGEEVQSNAVEVHIHHLRKKLPDKFIKTIRGVGYSVAKK